MPIINEVIHVAYCDICKSGNQVVTCAICGGVFCDKHSVTIEIKRIVQSEYKGELYRALCNGCLHKGQAVEDIIEGHPSNEWSDRCSEKDPKYRDENISGIWGVEDETDS